MTVSLTPEQETLLIPLYARAQLTRQGSPLLTDGKAVDIVRALDYDFTAFDSNPMLLVGSVLRTRIHDRWLEAWLTEHPAGTVVEIGAGLNTRFERVDNGQVHWVDLDLPEAMGLRREFFGESERRRLISASVTDEDWLAVVEGLPGPVYFVAEAVLIYLPESDVHGVFTRLAGRFPGALISFDTWGSWIRDHADELGAVTSMGAEVRWTCDDPRDLEQAVPGLHVLDSCTFPEAPRELVSLLPPDVQELIPQMANLPRATNYWQNLARLGG
jgi:O-methyltransferase involved in polyketide biosynthesis